MLNNPDKAADNKGFSTDQLNDCMEAYQRLLDKMKALLAIIPDCPPEVLEQHTSEISMLEKKCREMNVKDGIPPQHPLKETKRNQYQHLFSTIKAIEELNFKISKIMKSTMLTTTEELRNLRKTMPGIAGYANIQNTISRPVLKQQG